MHRTCALLAALTIAAATPAAGLRFKASGTKLVVPNHPAINFPHDFTLEAWVKPDSGMRNDIFKFILSKNYEGSGYALVAIGRDDAQRFQFEALNTIAYGIPEPILRGRWWHVAGVREGATNRLYVNGLLVAEERNTPPLRPNNLPLMIGSSLWSGLPGVVDEVRLWSIARSQLELISWKDRMLSGRERGLAAYWRFDEGRGYIVRDATGHLPAVHLGSTNKRDNADPQWVTGISLRRFAR